MSRSEVRGRAGYGCVMTRSERNGCVMAGLRNRSERKGMAVLFGTPNAMIKTARHKKNKVIPPTT